MTRLPLVSFYLLAVGSPPPVAAEATLAAMPPIVSEGNNPPVRARAVSPSIAAHLAAAAPKFEAAEPAKSTDAPADLREIDKPKNTIFRLPPYLVQEEKSRLPNERETLTPKGRLELALARHPGLRLGSFWIFRNDGIALAMLEEEERLERKKEMNDLLSLLPTAQRKEMKPVVEQAFMRP